MNWYKKSQNYFVDTTYGVDVNNDKDIDFKVNISWKYENGKVTTCPKESFWNKLRMMQKDRCQADNTFCGYFDDKKGQCVIVPPRGFEHKSTPPRDLLMQLQQMFGSTVRFVSLPPLH